MCTSNQLSIILQEVSQTARDVFAAELDTVYLYGSYARNSFDDGSDIDIMVIADIPKEELFRYKRPFTQLSSRLGMEFDTLITITLKDTATFRKYVDVLPFYQAVQKEGIVIAG